MKYIATTPPPKLHDKNLYKITVVYALIVVLCMLGQLFRFDNIISAVVASDAIDSQLGVIFWTILQVVQLFSLPFLLRLHVSPLMRIVSMICALIVPIFWATLAGWQLSVTTHTMGVFGAEVEALNVWWVTAVAALIGVVGFSASIGSIATNVKQLKTVLKK